MRFVITRDPREFEHRPAAGELQLARSDERPLLVEWMRDFERESGIGSGDRAEQIVDARLHGDGLLVWDARGPVSLLGVAPAVAGDLANPTSNKIYAEVGYQRISGWEEHAFLGVFRVNVALTRRAQPAAPARQPPSPHRS